MLSAYANFQLREEILIACSKIWGTEHSGWGKLPIKSAAFHTVWGHALSWSRRTIQRAHTVHSHSKLLTKEVSDRHLTNFDVRRQCVHNIIKGEALIPLNDHQNRRDYWSPIGPPSDARSAVHQQTFWRRRRPSAKATHHLHTHAPVPYTDIIFRWISLGFCLWHGENVSPNAVRHRHEKYKRGVSIVTELVTPSCLEGEK